MPPDPGTPLEVRASGTQRSRPRHEWCKSASWISVPVFANATENSEF